MRYLKTADPQTYKALSQYKPGSAQFDGVWKSIASHSGKKFDQLQHGFIKQSHFDPAAKKIKSSIGLDVTRYSPAVQNVLWSTAVQHGSAGAANVFRNAGIRPGMSEKEIITRVYKERMAGNGTKYFSRSSAGIRQSVVRRFQNEMRDALSMLG